jgi:hypothetical protein
MGMFFTGTESQDRFLKVCQKGQIWALRETPAGFFQKLLRFF